MTRRMVGQVRTHNMAVIGFDLTAAFALAGALGICPIAVAELLPDIETAAIAAMNQPTQEGGNGS